MEGNDRTSGYVLSNCTCTETNKMAWRIIFTFITLRSMTFSIQNIESFSHFPPLAYQIFKRRRNENINIEWKREKKESLACIETDIGKHAFCLRSLLLSSPKNTHWTNSRRLYQNIAHSIYQPMESACMCTNAHILLSLSQINIGLSIRFVIFVDFIAVKPNTSSSSNKKNENKNH